MGVPAGPFAGRLLSEIARHEGGMPSACAEMGVSAQDIEALAHGHAPSRVVLEAMYEWLGGQSALMENELEDYERLRDSTRQAAVAIPTGPSGAPGGRQKPAHMLGTNRRALIAVITAAVVAIVATTVTVTVVVTRPGSSNASSNSEASPSPSATSPPESPSPDAASGSPTASQSSATPASASSSPAAAPSAASGKLIGSYDNFELACGYTLTFGKGGSPQPVDGANVANYDFENNCLSDPENSSSNEFDTTTGEVALLSGSPSYASCAGDTDLGSSVVNLTPGNTVCFQGHGVLAATTITSFGSGGGNDYAKLNVRVWQYPQANPQGNGN